jgi:hypothetical protein
MAAGGVVSALVRAIQFKAQLGEVASDSKSSFIGLIGVCVPLCAWALWLAVLGFVLQTFSRNKTHEDADRAVIGAAVWVTIPQLWLWYARTHFGQQPPLWNGMNLLLCVAAPLGAALLAGFRIVDRRRWLERVADGDFAQWRLVEVQTSCPDLPVLTSLAATKALAWVHTGKGHPVNELIEPMAMVGRLTT